MLKANSRRRLPVRADDHYEIRTGHLSLTKLSETFEAGFGDLPLCTITAKNLLTILIYIRVINLRTFSFCDEMNRTPSKHYL